MKRVNPRIFWCTLAFGWVLIIFLLSNQEAKDSYELSKVFAGYFAQLFVKDFSNMTDAEQFRVAYGLHKAVRKYAHVFLFFVLGFLIMGTMSTYKLKPRTQFMVALALTFFCAVAGEIYQIFVPGRAALVGDVVINTVSGLTGISAMIGVNAIRELCRRKPTNRS